MNWRRRFGQETEYAVRRPYSGEPFPIRRSNHNLFLLIRGYITDRCRTLPGYRDFYQSQFFMENGGAFAYEAIPTAERDGLIEGATPECVTPYELLCHQRAQESWLKDALQSPPIRDDALFAGCGLLKNCRDAEGHIYGSQENYEVAVGNIFWRWIYRTIVCVSVPITFLATAVILAIVLILVLVIGLVALGVGTISLGLRFIAHAIPLRLFQWTARRVQSQLDKVIRKLVLVDEDRASQVANAVFFPALFVLLSPVSMLLSQVAFRSVRRGLSGFLASRVILSGAGSLLDENTFVLSEKASALRAATRRWATNASRTVFDAGNLLKGIHLAALDCFVFRQANWRFLLNGRQRLQIGCSDANRCDVAEYLKIGTTLLMIEMAEAGALKDAPRPQSLVRAMKAIIHDPSLKTAVACHKGQSLTALEIQRWHQRRAVEFLALNPDFRETFQPVVERWRSTLDLLEYDPEQLIGQLDWVTKRSLIDEAGRDQPFEVRKRIDLGYHELGTGYFERFEEAGLVTKIAKPEAIAKARTEPPSAASARIRSRFIRNHQEADSPWVVGWYFAIRGFFFRQRRRRFERWVTS